MGHPRLDELTACWARQLGCDPAHLTRPGTTLMCDPDRLYGRIDLFRTGSSTMLLAHPCWEEPLRMLIKRLRTPEGITADEMISNANAETLQRGHDSELYYVEPSTYRPCRRTTVRRLVEADEEDFRCFLQACPTEDRLIADIGWNHTALFGAFEDECIVSCASVEKGDGVITNITVLTLPSDRGRGWGRAVVTAACDWATQQHLIAQYRVTNFNPASRAIARALGLIVLARVETLHVNLAPHYPPERVFSGTKPAP